MVFFERITINPDVCNGKPTIRGMRISVKTILEFMAAGETPANILEAYPYLEEADIKACLEYAAWLSDRSIHTYPLAAA